MTKAATTASTPSTSAETAGSTHTEKHYGEDAQGETGKNVMNPQTIVYLGENSTMQMDTVQIRGIDSTLRDTRFYCEAGSEVVVTERLLTHGDQTAESDMTIELNGQDARGRVISRSVAQDGSRQVFRPVMVGNSQCFGHVQCDSIIMGAAHIQSVPAITANCPDAQLIHEAAIGKIAGDQLLKLETPGPDPRGGRGNHPQGLPGVKYSRKPAYPLRIRGLLAWCPAGGFEPRTPLLKRQVLYRLS